jgi:hypothetical protein
MADDVQITVGAAIESFESHMTQVREILEGLSSPIKAVRENLGEVAEAFIAGFAIEKIHEFYESLANLATQTVRTATLLGTNTEQVAGLTIAAQISGGSIGELTMSMERLGMSLARADAGSEQVKAGLHALGIEAKEFRSLSPEKQLEELADKFSRIKDGIDKDAIAMEIMGRGGAAMIPVFNQGAEAFREFQEMAERAGTAMSHETVEGFEKTHHSLTEFGAAMQGVSITIGSTFRTAFDGAIQIVTDMVESFNNAVKGSGALHMAFATLAASAKTVVSAIALIIATLETMWSVATEVVDQLGNLFVGLGKAIYDALHGSISAATSDLAAMRAMMAASAASTAADIKSVYSNMSKELDTIWGISAHHQEEIERNKVARLAITNKDAASAAMMAAEGAIKAADLQYSRTKEMLEAQYKVHAITEQQMTQATIEAVNAREAAELAAIAKAESRGGLTLAEHQKLENEKTKITQTAINERQKLQDKALEIEVKNWTSALSSIQSAWDSQLRGLLAGTTSFSAAMKSVFADLVLDIIKGFEKIALEKAALGLANLFGTSPQSAIGGLLGGLGGAGGSAATTANTTALSKLTTAVSALNVTMGGHAAVTATDTAATATDTAVTAADTAATTAHTGVTLSSIAATASNTIATVANTIAEGVKAIIPGFASGADMVTQSGLAVVHQGEAIIPAAEATAYSGGASSGGDITHNWNISAVDARSFSALLSDPNSGLRQSIVQMFRNGQLRVGPAGVTG